MTDAARTLRRLQLLLVLLAVFGVSAGTAIGAAAPSTPAAVRAGGSASGAIVPGSVNRTSVNLTATHAVDLAVRYGDRAIRIDSTATITNTSGTSIDRVELNTVAARLGSMTLDRVSVDGRIIRASVSDQTIVVPLGGVLAPRSTTNVRVILHATVRTATGGSDWLFTRAGGVIDLYRAIPWISLRHPFGRANQGDPFVTPNSPLVTLKLTTDRPMVAAINAQRTSVSADGKVQTFVAENVRDIPLALSPNFRVTRSMLGRTEILVYTQDGGAQTPSALIANARRFLSSIGSLLGRYPWPRFIVVATPGGYAMEGPGTIWIPPGVAPSNLPYIVAHETAHQWTPGLVGSDQWSDPFADEAVADMVARYLVDIHRASRCPTARLDLPITSYSAACYYEAIYIQGGNWLNTLRVKMGNATYWSAMRAYVVAHRWGLAGTRSLLDTLDAATPLDVAALAKRRFPGRY